MSNIKWVAAYSGTWQSANDWDIGLTPGASDDVSILASGLYTVEITAQAAAGNVIVNDAGATVDLRAALAVGGTFGIDAGTLYMDGGVVSGGTIAPITGSFLVSTSAANTLAGVTVQGSLSYSSGWLQLSQDTTVQGGVTVTNGNLEFDGETTVATDVQLNNSTLWFANPAPVPGVIQDTGVDAGGAALAGGAADPSWSVSTGGQAVVLTNPYPGWQPDDAGSAWIGAVDSVYEPPAPYSFTTTFTLTAAQALDDIVAGLWYIDDSGTLSLNGTVIASGGSNGMPFVLSHLDGLLAGTNTLTITMTSSDQYYDGVRLQAALDQPEVIAPGVVIQGSGDIYDDPNGQGAVTLDNQGTILANVGNQTLSIAPAVLVNDGLIEAEYGAHLDVDYNDRSGQLGINAADGTIAVDQSTLNAGSAGNNNVFDNAGLITGQDATLYFGGGFGNTGSIVATGSTLDLGDPNNTTPWSNTGVVDATDTAIYLRGSITTGDVGTLNRTGGSLTVYGAIDNTGATIDATQGAFANLYLDGGSITGGTLIDGANGSLGASSNQYNTLSDVAVLGGLTLNGGYLALSNGTAVDGAAAGSPGTITLNSASLELDSVGTLSASVVLNASDLHFDGGPAAAAQPIFATGVDAAGAALPGGAADPHWNVDVTAAPAVVLTDPYPGWLSDNATGAWIGAYDLVVGQPPAPYTFSQTFDLGTLNPLSTIIVGEVLADDAGYLSINGQQVTGNFGYGGSGNYVAIGDANGWLNAGSNTIGITIDSADDYYEGIRASFTVLQADVIAAGAAISGYGTIDDNSYGRGVASVDNLGTIDADVAGQSMFVDPTAFQNDGTMLATDGGNLYIEFNQQASWVNAADGTIIAEAGGNLYLGGLFANLGSIITSGGTLVLGAQNDVTPWSNSGVVRAQDTTIYLRGDITTADIGSIQGAGNSITLNGTIDNTGATIDPLQGTFATCPRWRRDHRRHADRRPRRATRRQRRHRQPAVGRDGPGRPVGRWRHPDADRRAPSSRASSGSRPASSSCRTKPIWEAA